MHSAAKWRCTPFFMFSFYVQGCFIFVFLFTALLFAFFGCEFVRHREVERFRRHWASQLVAACPPSENLIFFSFTWSLLCFSFAGSLFFLLAVGLFLSRLSFSFRCLCYLVFFSPRLIPRRTIQCVHSSIDGQVLSSTHSEHQQRQHQQQQRRMSHTRPETKRGKCWLISFFPEHLAFLTPFFLSSCWRERLRFSLSDFLTCCLVLIFSYFFFLPRFQCTWYVWFPLKVLIFFFFLPFPFSMFFASPAWLSCFCFFFFAVPFCFVCLRCLSWRGVGWRGYALLTYACECERSVSRCAVSPALVVMAARIFFFLPSGHGWWRLEGKAEIPLF